MSDWSGLPLRYRTEWRVKVQLDGTSQDGISEYENLTRAALAIPYQDFKFLCNDGTFSSLTLLNADTLSGLRVVDVSVLEADGKEYTTTRTLRFTVVGEYPIANYQNAIMSYEETLTVVGTGGANRIWRFPIDVPFGTRQILTPASLSVAIQSGRAVGYLQRPSPPPPLFNSLQYEVLNARKMSVFAPQWLGRAFINFGIEWEYRFERGDGLAFQGFPVIPPQYLILTG